MTEVCGMCGGASVLYRFHPDYLAALSKQAVKPLSINNAVQCPMCRGRGYVYPEDKKQHE